MLDDKNLDAISIATPNHWHSLMTIWACQAGKDVYVEKPCSHNVHEGRVAVEAARKYDRIVQHGTQSRSDSHWARSSPRSSSRASYGKLLVSRGLCYKPRGSHRHQGRLDGPGELDFNLWLGPAPEQPFNANYVHYNWHWFWDFGNGDIGNQGVHQMDIARWMIPGATLPKTVFSLGGRFGYKDQGQTPNTQIAVMDFGGTAAHLRGPRPEDRRLQGREGRQHRPPRGGNVVGSRVLSQGQGRRQGRAAARRSSAERGPGKGHFGNFIAAVRSRKTADLNADILEGHHSAALCHLANISYRLGELVPFNSKTKAFGDNKVAATRPSSAWRTTSAPTTVEARRPRVPPGPQADGRRQERVVRRRPRGQQAPDPRVPQAVRRAGADFLKG